MKRSTMSVSFGACVLYAWSVAAVSGSATERLQTPLEQANFSRISTSAEISAFLDALVASTPLARNETIGKSAEGRPIEVLRISEHLGAADDAPSPGGRLTVMIVGSQHGAAEPAGGEALLVVARELVAGPLRALLKDIDVVLLPNANPDGRDLRRRANANWININTDFVLLTQPESRVLKAALRRYAPEALLDSHESAILKRKTLAREGYLTDFDAQFEVSNNPAVPKAVANYALAELLPMLTQRVSEAGLPAHRYIGEITSTTQPITHGGLTLRNFRNTAGLSGALSFLVETKLDSREDSFPTYRNIAVRQDRQLICVRSFLALMHERRGEILQQVALARAALHKEPLTLYAGYAADPEHPTVKLQLRRLDTRAPVELEFPDHRRVEIGGEIEFPPMYVVTHHTDKLRELLDRHELTYQDVATPLQTQVTADRFAVQEDITTPVRLIAEERKLLDVPPGSILIDLAQPDGRLVPLLLDPRSTSSIFRYPGYAALLDPQAEHFAYRTFKGIATAEH